MNFSDDDSSDEDEVPKPIETEKVPKKGDFGFSDDEEFDAPSSLDASPSKNDVVNQGTLREKDFPTPLDKSKESSPGDFFLPGVSPQSEKDEVLQDTMPVRKATVGTMNFDDDSDDDLSSIGEDEFEKVPSQKQAKLIEPVCSPGVGVDKTEEVGEQPKPIASDNEFDNSFDEDEGPKPVSFINEEKSEDATKPLKFSSDESSDDKDKKVTKSDGISSKIFGSSQPVKDLDFSSDEDSDEDISPLRSSRISKPNPVTTLSAPQSLGEMSSIESMGGIEEIESIPVESPVKASVHDSLESETAKCKAEEVPTAAIPENTGKSSNIDSDQSSSDEDSYSNPMKTSKNAPTPAAQNRDSSDDSDSESEEESNKPKVSAMERLRILRQEREKNKAAASDSDSDSSDL